MSSIQLPLNLFDLVLVAMLVVGIMRGRKQGMSEELLSLLTWLCVVIGCALTYRPLGRLLASSTGMFSMLTCFILAYIVCALIIFAIFAAVKRSFGGKLLGSDIFGSAEYYLGMGSGMVRFACILLAGLALLNARAYDAAEAEAMRRFQNDEFGSNYFPTLQTVQATVFQRSLTGSWIHRHLGFLLIGPTAPESRQFKQREYSLP